MRSEIRKTTTTVVEEKKIWIACDGTEWENRLDCWEHEGTIKEEEALREIDDLLIRPKKTLPLFEKAAKPFIGKGMHNIRTFWYAVNSYDDIRRVIEAMDPIKASYKTDIDDLDRRASYPDAICFACGKDTKENSKNTDIHEVFLFSEIQEQIKTAIAETKLLILEKQNGQK